MVVNLSGGNQQKVSVAKWLFVEARCPHPGRADARHRRRGEIRDLQHHEQAGGAGNEHHHDLLRAAGSPGHERQDLRDILGEDHRRAARRGGDAGKNHATGDELGER